MRDDILLRAIRQLVEALVRAVGLRKAKDHRAADEALGAGLGTFGVSRELVDRIDAVTLARVLGDDNRRASVAVLLAELARNADAAGAPDDEAARLRAKARALCTAVDVTALDAELRALLMDSDLAGPDDDVEPASS